MNPDAMKWFVAHVIVTIRFDDGIQSSYPGWENMYLVQAADWSVAARKAETIARQEPASITCDDRPAHLVVEGVRKVAFLWPDGPVDGVELTHTAIEVRDLEALRKLVDGEAVEVIYDDLE